MNIVDLRPEEQYTKREQCSVRIEDMDAPIDQFYLPYRLKKAKRTGKDPARCQKTSKFLIDGKHYCAGHAGMVTIDHVLSRPPRITREQLEQVGDMITENVERILR